MLHPYHANNDRDEHLQTQINPFPAGSPSFVFSDLPARLRLNTSLRKTAINFDKPIPIFGLQRYRQSWPHRIRLVPTQPTLCHFHPIPHLMPLHPVLQRPPQRRANPLPNLLALIASLKPRRKHAAMARPSCFVSIDAAVLQRASLAYGCPVQV